MHQAFAGHPEKMLVLEMGGNNPLIVHEADNLDAAAYMTIQSAYITAGQRCVCARRLILPTGKEGDLFLDLLIKWIHQIQVGPFRQKPEPFMGPVISKQAASSILKSAGTLESRGGLPIVELKQLATGSAFLSPGLMDVTGVQERGDEEIFGPLLQVIRVPDFACAIKEANHTRFGLAAGLLSDNEDNYKIFQRLVRAGIKNWNRQTTGATGAMPFGGTGLSGNFRPSAFFAADYTAYPVASIESESLSDARKSNSRIVTMTEKALEVNFDGLIGNTHHFGGLAHGNLASSHSRHQISHPRKAALQGLAKMEKLHDLGIPQALLPPLERPDIQALREIGYAGDAQEILRCVALGKTRPAGVRQLCI